MSQLVDMKLDLCDSVFNEEIRSRVAERCSVFRPVERDKTRALLYHEAGIGPPNNLSIVTSYAVSKGF